MPQLGAAIAGIATAFKATALGAFLTQNVFGRLLASVALSALSAAMQPTPAPAGITTDFTQSGSTNPLSFIIGKYATAGSMVCPPMSHGKVGKVPNAYLTYVVDLGDVPGQTLKRVIIDGAYEPLAATTDATYGTNFSDRIADYAWLKYYDGSQTTADPMLLSKYSDYPERPWQSDMIGRGKCYAILTFRYNRELFSGFPSVRFEMGGIPFYDPRLDSTVGGSGPQRWNNKATWGETENALVIAYNVMRGIDVPDLCVWGGEIEAADLPLSSWFTAMNACDAPKVIPGGTEPAYRAGFEVKVDMEPATVLEEIFKASATRVAEVAGRWKVRTGGPGLPVMFITDDDFIVTKPQELDPFPGDAGRRNGITASYPAPAALWETKPAKPLYNTTWETEDGNRRRVADLSLPACPYPRQVRRLMVDYAKDDRRQIIHRGTLPPDAAILESLDTVSYTSARNGYAGKLFEIGQVADELRSYLQAVEMRECDPTDFGAADDLGTLPPDPSTKPATPGPATVPGFAVYPHTLKDATGADRRPALRAVWDADNMDGVRAIKFQVRLAATAAMHWQGNTKSLTEGEEIIAGGIVGGIAYQVRARLVADFPTAWGAWVDVTAGDAKFSFADMAAPFNDAFDDAVATAAAALSGHNALVAGFTGTLVDGFNAVNTTTTALAATQASHAASIGGLNTSVTNILGCRADLLTGTALAALLTQLNVSTSTGLSAWATSQAAAVATLNGKVSASYVFRVGAGGAGAGLEMVAQDSAVGGPVSTFKINADYIDLVGKVRIRDLLVSASDNLFADPDMLDDTYYSGAARWFLNTSTAALGKRFMGIDVQSFTQYVYSDWFALEVDTEYLVRGAAWMAGSTAGGGNALLSLQTGTVDGSGAVTVSRDITIKNAVDAGYSGASHASVSVTTTATERVARMRFGRGAGGTLSSRFGGVSVRRKTKTDLMVDGSVTAAKLNTDDLAVAGVSIFGGTLKSSNYVAGVSGWRFSHSGTLEIRNLIDRSALTSDAVGDRTQSTLLTAANFTSAAQTHLTHTVGPVPFGAIFKRAVVFEARHVSPSGYATTVTFEIRRKYAGVWEAWDVLTTWTFAGTDSFSDWRCYVSTATLAGNYDDIQYRVVSSRPGGAAISGIRNIYITTINVAVP